jgi:spermidine synthase
LCGERPKGSTTTQRHRNARRGAEESNVKRSRRSPSRECPATNRIGKNSRDAEAAVARATTRDRVAVSEDGAVSQRSQHLLPSREGSSRVSRNFEELAFHQTSLGDLSLRRRRLLSLGGIEVYEVKLGEAFLMSSLFHVVEDALADLGLSELAGERCDVVVGGLGLGYTARAALQHTEVASLLVVDALQPVIDWHQTGLVPLGRDLTDNQRCRMICADFFGLAQSSAGFDPARPGRRFHAVLLDIDHSPRNLLDAQNATFYSPDGLRALAAHLLPAGVFALWSDDPPDEEFMRALSTTFNNVRAHIVSFPNPLLEEESASTVYVAGCPAS